METIELYGGIIDGNRVVIPKDHYLTYYYDVYNPLGDVYRYSRTDRKTAEGLTIFEYQGKTPGPVAQVDAVQDDE